MKIMNRRRVLSFLLALAMFVSLIPSNVFTIFAVETDSNDDATSESIITSPFTPETEFKLPDGTTTTSKSYRIPSMVTLADGTIVAAADIRWNTTYDGGGLDTLVATSKDGGATWSYKVANYLGDNGNVYNASSSTAFLDPSLLVAKDGKTVYMLVDLYPYGVALNGSGNTPPSTAVGFNTDGNLLLSDDNHISYNYYLKDGKIFTSNHAEVSGYVVDKYFNITGEDGTNSNLFFENSPFKVVRTGYLYLTSSTDGGETWSEPQLLNVKTTSEWACLLSPGNSITTSDGTMIYPVYSYHGDNAPEGNTQRLSFIYSKDGVNWSRTTEFNANTAGQKHKDWASEAAVVELQDGTLRFFIRNGYKTLSYVDYDMATKSWGSVQSTGIATNSNTQLSAITYTRTIGGEQVIMVSCPTGSNREGSNSSSGGARLNGSIFVFTVDAEGNMTLKHTLIVNDNDHQFMYSCLTERPDGSIAILYEEQEHGWGVSGGTGDSYDASQVTTYYTLAGMSFTIEEMGVVFDVTVDEEEIIDTKVIFKEGVTQVPLHVDPAAAPTETVTVDVALFDGIYKVAGTYIDKEANVLYYRLECCVGDTWPAEYDEYRYVPADLLEETDQGLANPIVDFTNAAPLFGYPEAQPAVATYMARSAATFGTRAFAARSAVSNATNGLALYKDVTSKGNGIYEIVLEAYTTGTVTVSTVTKPMDIVLVIDQSGSMSYCIEHGQSMTHNMQYTQVDADDVKADGVYYRYSNRNYSRLYYCTYNGGCGNWHTSEYYTSNNNHRNASAYHPNSTNFYIGTSSCTRRYDALVDALDEFVQSVQSKTRGENDEIIDHRIAIVGFSSGDYNNTELLTGVNFTTDSDTNIEENNVKYYPENMQYNGVQYGSITDEQYRNALQDVSTSDGYSNVTAAIGALTAHGGTQTLDGMNMAYEILNQNTKKDENRDQVVILFTDGATNSTRSTLLNKAYDIKQTLGATVYGVGIFSGANGTPPTSNPTDITNDNQLMHLISSNYPSARYENRLSAGTRNPLLDNGVSYYLSASDADALREIFQNISTTISNAASELNQEATIRDIVTPQFVVPANTNSVKVYQVPYTGTGDSWGTAEELDANQMVTINTTDNTLSVTGFDFKHNFVSETGRKEDNEKEQGSFYGRKIRIVFTVTENPDFLGGSNAHTNGADSGVYDANGNPAGMFNRPTVDVPLKEISTVAKDKHIYYGNTTDLTGILNLHVKASSSGKYLQDLANGINNAYVNLKYTITINNQDVVYYTIPAGTLWNEGTWTKVVNGVVEEIEMDKVNIENDTPYGIICDMTDAGGSLNPTKADGNAIIYVYKPTLTFKDSIQKYKETLNLGTDVNSFLNAHRINVTWSHTSQTATPEGTAPEFAYTFSYGNSTAFDGFVMNSTQDVPVSVTVTIKGHHVTVDANGTVTSTDVAESLWLEDLTRSNTDKITFAHATCNHSGCGFSASTEEFIVHVIGALTSLTIQKSGWSSLDPNQTFLFNIAGKDADGNNINLTVTVHGNGSVTIYGLVIGNQYTVTELTDWSWRYQCTGWTYNGVSGSDELATITIVENQTITFNNSRPVDKWLDGDAWCDNLFNLVTTVKDDEE